MSTHVLPPESVDLDGAVWHVARAWTSGDGRMSVELRRGQAVRAGHWDGARLEVLPPNADPRLPALAAVLARRGPAGTVVSHRAGRRAVVRGADGVFHKVVRPGRASGVLAGVAQAAAFDGPFRTPAVLDHDPSVVTFAALPGRSLHDAAGWSPTDWRHAWHDVLTAWTRGVSHGVRMAGRPVHDAAAEAGVLRDWVRRAEPYGSPAPGWAEACERAVSRLLDLGPADGGPVPIHRDLHDKQLLWDAASGPGLLDADTACAGDPGVDLGNLRAHARWRHVQGLWTAEQSAVVLARIEAAASEVGCSPRRLAVFAEAARLRLSCVYALRPRWRRAVTALVAAGSDEQEVF